MMFSDLKKVCEIFEKYIGGNKPIAGVGDSILYLYREEAIPGITPEDDEILRNFADYDEVRGWYIFIT